MMHADFDAQRENLPAKSARARSALVTLTIGQKYEELARITHSYFRSYAARHNLSFEVIREPRVSGKPHFQKLACYELLTDYERLIFVDTDVLITPDAPNLLEIVPADRFGAHAISRHTLFHDVAILFIQNQLREIGWRHDYFNSGVMVASRVHKPIFDPLDEDLSIWSAICSNLPEKKTFSDQTYLNFKVQQKCIPFFDIGYKFNHSLVPGRSAERFRSYFIHCKGHRRGPKETEIARAAYVLDRPRLRAVFAKFPFITRAYDRLV